MSGKRTEYKLDVAIGGKVDGSLAKSVGSINNKLGSIGKTAKTVAATATAVFASIKIKDLISETIEASKLMETSMAGVAKVVDGLKDENGKVTKSYYEMKDSILDLSKELPMTADSIASIMEAAGQSNIAKSELLEFSETATKMGIAFDTTADKSGEWMAAWRTALDLDQNEVTTLADQINYLGNTSSENAIKLSEVVTTIGSLASTAGVTGDTVAAMGASMTKVDSNVASTGIKNFLLALSMGESATDKQEGAYNKLGLKAENIAKAMQIDSKGTILDVLERISKLDKHTQTATMKDLFGRESLASIAPMVANLDNLKEQFNKVGDAALYAGSMEKEYLAASSTNANIDVLRDNKIEAMKIQIGDAIVPLSAMISEATGNTAASFGDFVQEHKPMISSAVRGISRTFEEIGPNVVYNLKSLADTGKEVFNKLAPLGSWIVENPSVIPNFIITTGTAMTTYKIGNQLKDIANSAKSAGGPLKYLSSIITNPWGLAIAGVATGIAFIATSIHSANKELKEADLEARFGNISLSLSDLDEVAGHIIKNRNLDKLSESLDISNGFKELEDAIQSSVEEMSKFNWKVSIGLDLTEEEKARYKNDVTNYIADTQTLLEEQQYSLVLALEVFSDGSSESEKIKESINSFYANNQAELSELGKKLNEAVNESFSDGILTIDEANEIEKLQQQIASITQQIANSEFEATMQVSKTKLVGSDLTADSFSNLMDELNEQSESYDDKSTEAYKKLVANSYTRYSSGTISEDDYNAELETFKIQYLGNISDSTISVTDFGLDTLYDAYDKELNEVIPKFTEYMQESAIDRIDDASKTGKWYELEDGLQFDFNMFDGLDKGAKLALMEQLESLEPTYDQLISLRDSYNEAGIQVPEGIYEGISNITMLRAITGDTESIMALVGQTLTNSPETAQAIQSAINGGYFIDQGLIDGLSGKLGDIKNQSKNIVKVAADGINEELDKGTLADAIARLDKILNPGKSPAVSNLLSDINNINQKVKLPGYAKGDIIEKPTLATFAEDCPEAAIPLNGSSRSKQLWKIAGERLGLFHDQNTASFDIGYNIKTFNEQTVPAIAGNSQVQPIEINYHVTIKGNASQADIQKATTMSQQEFDRMMKTYQKNYGRTTMS